MEMISSSRHGAKEPGGTINGPNQRVPTVPRTREPQLPTLASQSTHVATELSAIEPHHYQGMVGPACYSRHLLIGWDIYARDLH